MNRGDNHFDLAEHVEAQFLETLRQIKFENNLSDDLLGEFFGYAPSTIRGLLNGNQAHRISAGRALYGLRRMSSAGILTAHRHVLDAEKWALTPAVRVDAAGSFNKEGHRLAQIGVDTERAVEAGDVKTVARMRAELLYITDRLKAEEDLLRSRFDKN